MFSLKRILGRAIGPSRGKAITATAMCALMLVACGQRGPLYLPEPGKTPSKKPATTTPSDAPAVPAQR